MPAISLIIPLYNAVRHLRGCLNSVKAQTFTDFEVLLINDGSTAVSYTHLTLPTMRNV